MKQPLPRRALDELMRDARAEQARLQLARKTPKKAIASLRRALEFESGSREALALRVLLARRLRLADRVELARAEVDAVLQADPSRSDARLELARLLARVDGIDPGALFPYLSWNFSQETRIHYGAMLAELAGRFDVSQAVAFLMWERQMAQTQGGLSAGGFIGAIGKRAREKMNEEVRAAAEEALSAAFARLSRRKTAFVGLRRDVVEDREERLRRLAERRGLVLEEESTGLVERRHGRKGCSRGWCRLRLAFALRCHRVGGARVALSAPIAGVPTPAHPGGTSGTSGASGVEPRARGASRSSHEHAPNLLPYRPSAPLQLAPKLAPKLAGGALEMATPTGAPVPFHA